MSPDTDAIAELERYATAYRDDELEVRRVAAAFADVRQNLEDVIRLTLVLSDPADETWDVGRLRQMRLAFGRKAVELGLPGVSLTLIAESEPEAVAR